MKSINYEVLRMQQAAESAFDFDCKRCGSDDIKILTGKNKGKAQCENCLNIWTWQSVKLDSEPARTVPSDENAFKKMEKKSTKNETANWTDKLAGLKAKYLGEGSSETTREHVDKPVSKERSKYLEKTTDPIYDDFTSNAAKSAPKEGSKPTKEPVDLSDDDFAWPTQKLKRKKRPASPKLDDDTSGSEFVPDTNDDVPGDNSEDDEDLDYVRQPATKKARRRSAKRRADTMTIKSEEKESDDDDDVDVVGAPSSKTRKRNPVTVRGKIEAKNEQKELRALHRLVICKSTPVPDEKSVEEIIETDSDEAEQERVYEFNPLNVFSDEENDTALDKKRKRSRVAPAVDFDEQPKNPKAHFVPRPANKFNAFFLYNAEQRKVISENNPDLAPARISKLIAENWKNLPEEEKAKYKERSQKQKQEWLEAQGLNRQRLPPNGYVLFSNSIFREIKSEHPEYEMKEISAIIGARWKKLDPEKKKEFNDKSKELRAKFKEENPQTYEEWIKRRNEASKVTKNKNKYL